jgi:hypothetical protein
MKITFNKSRFLRGGERKVTDRFKGVTVTFDRDIRDDDAEYIINAIRMIKGIIDVTPSVTNFDDYMNRARIRHEIEDKIWKALRETESK